MVAEETRNRIIILGVGVTGLSAGIRFLDSGHDVSILEKAAQPGGLAKTVVRGNYRLDIGPHHLFSQNETILKEITDLFESDELVPFSRDVAKIKQSSPTVFLSLTFHFQLPFFKTYQSSKQT